MFPSHDPSDKPHEYKTLIQVGFSLHPSRVEQHARIFSGAEKGMKCFVFWTAENITEIYNQINFNAIRQYSELLNKVCKRQFVEDKRAKKMMEAAGFEVEILPLPLKASDDAPPLPKQKRVLACVTQDYGHLMGVLEKSLPDIEFSTPENGGLIEDYSGLLHLRGDKTVTSNIKRFALSGRPIISNIQAPHAGYINDEQDPTDRDWETVP